MDIMRGLVERKISLQSKEPETVGWARAQGLVYAFDQEGNLLASGT